MAFSLKPKGRLVIDEGAARAIISQGKSLLPSGITQVLEEFGVGDPVQIQSMKGETLANGIVNYSAGDIRKIKGLRTNQIIEKLGEKPYDEVIHRDNLVLTDGESA